MALPLRHGGQFPALRETTAPHPHGAATDRTAGRRTTPAFPDGSLAVASSSLCAGQSAIIQVASTGPDLTMERLDIQLRGEGGDVIRPPLTDPRPGGRLACRVETPTTTEAY